MWHALKFTKFSRTLIESGILQCSAVAFRSLRRDVHDFGSSWNMRMGAESNQREIAAFRTFCALYIPNAVSSVAAIQIDHPSTRVNAVGQRSHSGFGPQTEPLSRIDQPQKKNR